MLNSGTLYLMVAGALIFGAGAYAAKRILHQLAPKQMGVISLITIATIFAIWGLLAMATKKRETIELTPEVTEPTAALHPSP